MKNEKTEKTTRTEPPRYWGLAAHEFLWLLKDKPITVTTMDGKAYNGILVGHDQYDLLIRQNSGLVIMIPKHAIKLVHPAGEK